MRSNKPSAMSIVLERIRRENPEFYRRLTRPDEGWELKHIGGVTPERVVRYPF